MIYLKARLWSANEWCANLLLLYVISTGVINIMEFPILGVKFQLSEFIFICICIFFFTGKKKLFKDWKMVLLPIDCVLLALWAFFGLSCFYSGVWQSWLEWIGFSYLLIFYLFFSHWIANGRNNYWRLVMKAIVIMGLISALVGIVGWIGLVCFGIETGWADWYLHYPYLGNTPRASGLCAGSSMLALILEMVILVYGALVIGGRGLFSADNRIFQILLTGLLLTFSKTIIPVVGGLLLLWNKKTRFIPQAKAGVFFGFLLLLYVFGTHIVLYKNSTAARLVGKERFLSDVGISLSADFLFVPTTYYTLKKAEIFMLRSGNWWGIGSGNFCQLSDELKEKGVIPAHIPSYDPHSTFLGSFVELGILSGVMIVTGFAILFIQAIRILRTPFRNSFLIQHGLGIFFLVTIVEGISADILFFRHLWVGFALAAGIFRRNRLLAIEGQPKQ